MGVVQRVNSERLVLLGWSRAILLQIAHPLVAAGVLEHSTFRGGVVQAAVRLHHTVSAMLALTFGDAEGRAAAVARIAAIHRRVHGTLDARVGPFPAGTPYSAEDPALLLWVHATLLDSVAGVYERLVAPLSTAERDALCVESAPLLVELGGDPRLTPMTWDSLQRYMAGIYDSNVLAVSPAARDLGLAVMSPRAAGVPLPFGGLHQLVTAGLLPPPVRAAYGLPWSPARERRFVRTMAWLRRVRRGLPRRVAQWPAARAMPAR